MTKRKIDLQGSAGRQSGGQEIDRLVRDMGTTSLGFSPTDQTVYEVDLDRIQPDFSQARHFLPFDLREALLAGNLSAREAISELVKRSQQGDQLAILILGGSIDVLDEEGNAEDDKGLLALAASIKSVGLRQPINLYQFTNTENPGEPYYRIGEGERRYWAHGLLVSQGYEEYSKIRALIEPLPADQDVIQRRQEAENAARQDLSAIARARAIRGIRTRLNSGTRVPDQTTIKLPSQHELDDAVGQEVKILTGRAISGRMVRNYVRLLNLPTQHQDLAEAAQLTEKQLRSVFRLKTEAEQLQLIKQIINERLSGKDVLARVKPGLPTSSLRRTSSTTLEKRLEKRLYQTAKTVHEVMALGEDSYTTVLQVLAQGLSDTTTREAFLALQQVLNDLFAQIEGQAIAENEIVDINEIQPPIDMITRYLSDKHRQILSQQMTSGFQIMELLLEWQQNDPLVASTLTEFLNQVERYASQIQAREFVDKPTLKIITPSSSLPQQAYQVLIGKTIYWAHVLLVIQDNTEFRQIKVEITL